MMKLKVGVLLLVLVVAIAFIGLLASGEANRTALLNQQGFVVEGGKFGVSVGQPTETAMTILRRSKWKYVDVQNGGYCIRHRYPEDTKVVIFFDNSWRKITLCVGTKYGHVVSIQWHAAPFTPEL